MTISARGAVQTVVHSFGSNKHFTHEYRDDFAMYERGVYCTVYRDQHKRQRDSAQRLVLWCNPLELYFMRLQMAQTVSVSNELILANLS